VAATTIETQISGLLNVPSTFTLKGLNSMF